jgi:hypothetical protein
MDAGPDPEGGRMTERAARPRATTTMQKVTVVVSVVFLLVGILGFIPGITTHFDMLSFAGHHSMAKLLGVFNVSVLHNLVHLAFGVIGLAAARHANSARTYLIAGGIVYLVLFVYGLVIDKTSSANFVPLNTADNWLHLILAIGMIGLGVALTRGARADDRVTV